MLRRELFILFLRVVLITGTLWILIKGGTDFLTPLVMVVASMIGLQDKNLNT
jgi:hypothetical protein